MHGQRKLAQRVKRISKKRRRKKESAGIFIKPFKTWLSHPGASKCHRFYQTRFPLTQQSAAAPNLSQRTACINFHPALLYFVPLKIFRATCAADFYHFTCKPRRCLLVNNNKHNCTACCSENSQNKCSVDLCNETFA